MTMIVMTTTTKRYSSLQHKGKVINLLQCTQARQAASETLRYMARTKQRRTYLP